MRGSRSIMLGEARWQEQPLDRRDLLRLLAKAPAVPSVVDDPLLVLWGRGGLERPLVSERMRGYDLAQMLAPDGEDVGPG